MSDHAKEVEAEKLGSLVRALEIANDLPRSGPRPTVPVEVFERDTRRITARIRQTMAERNEPDLLLEPLVLTRAPIQWAPLVALTITTVAVAIFPHQLVPSIALFGLLPLLLGMKWALEAYTGPELGTECDIIDQRAHALRHVRLRLDRLAEALAAASGPNPSPQVRLSITRVQSASDSARTLAAHVAKTSKATRRFAQEWFDDPVASCSGYRQETTAIRQEAVDLVDELRGMVVDTRSSTAADVALGAHAAELVTASDGSRAKTAGDELEAIVDDLDRHRTALADELRHLVHAFDRVHHAATLRAISTRVASRRVRIAARIGVTANAWLLRRERRTPARTVFLIEARIPRDASLRRVRRAAAAMRREVA